MQFLCLDSNYLDRIYIKKLGKAVAEFAQNEEFRAIGHMKPSELEQAEQDAAQDPGQEDPRGEAEEQEEDQKSE